MKRLLITLAWLAAVATIAACSSGVKLEDENKGVPVEERTGTSGTPSTGSTAPTTTSRDVTQVNVDPAKDPLNDPAGPLAKRSIYFDYDSFVVRDEYRALLDAHARYLNTNKNRKMVVQGNTDERGSREYNLALGQKRSEAVRKSLSALGVPEAQIEAVSFGEEKPKATGSDEASFAENRRADLVYP